MPQKDDDRAVTILQISDIQFGAHHGFGATGYTEADRDFDSLANRLLRDLTGLKERRGLVPDLLILPGDLAEHAKRREFEQVYDFIEQVREGLDLPSGRVVIVPGNHDVNWDKCRAYLLECRAEDIEPQKPYWPKWQFYAALHNRLYDTPFTFEEPWLYLEVPDLMVAVAGLNSTIAETHENHFGLVEERQLRWFAERMRKREADGWLRLGVLHHNPVRRTGQDDAYLTDVDDFVNLLVPHLNLVLHGHTHETRIGSLGPDRIPVLGSGSAGVDEEARAPGVPNQYQLVRVTATETTVHAQRYNRPGKRWEIDTSISEHGDSGQRVIQMSPRNVQAALRQPSARRQPSSTSDDDPDPAGLRRRLLDPALDRSDGDTLLDRVEVVCRTRWPAATVDATDTTPPYLRLCLPGKVTELFAVVPVNGDVTARLLDRIDEQILHRYRVGGMLARSYLVYDGPPAAEGVVERAAGHGVSVVSMYEFQGGYDLRPFAARQADRLALDSRYQSRLYVPQRYTQVGDPDARVHEDLLADLTRWLDDPLGRFVVVLGNFGYGKTFLLRQLAQRLHEERRAVVPVLIEMRGLEKAHSLDQLLATQLTAGGEQRIDLLKLAYLIEEGMVALLFDGFDELAVRVSYDRAADHLATITRAYQGRAKLVLTSRDQHFLTDSQVKTAVRTALADRLGDAARLVRLADFTRDQIERYLTNDMGDAGRARDRLAALEKVRDLIGLARNPRMLDFVARIDEARLRDAAERADGVTAAVLYQELIDSWLEHEVRRRTYPGAAPTLSVERCWDAVRALALRLWTATEPAVDVSDIGLVAEALGEIADGPPWEVPQLTLAIGSGTLLVRDPEGRFSFAHQSIVEWLVARQVADILADEGDLMPLVSSRPLTPLAVDFLHEMADPDLLQSWAMSTAADPDAPAEAKANAVQMSLNLGAVSLAGGVHRGADLSGRDLRNADLTGVDLTDARLVGTDLSGAVLANAILRRARLDRAICVGTRFLKADLTSARLLGTNLSGADLTLARLNDATLVGSVGWEQANKAPIAGHMRQPGSSVLSVAVGPDGAWIVSGNADQMVRIWDTATGSLRRILAGHTGWVWSVAVSPDGSWLASGSNDGSVRIWDVVTGAVRHVLTGHAGWVLSVAVGPDGSWLVSGSSDGSVRIWDVVTGAVQYVLTGHAGGVRSVAVGPDGSWLVSGSSDGSVRIWDTTTWAVRYILTGHAGGVRSVAVGPDGSWLASGGNDGTVKLWDTTTWTVRYVLTGHAGWVLSVAVGPDGSWLASGGSDGSVRIWDAVTGAVRHILTEHTDGVRSVAVGPHGTGLASGSNDRTVRVWDTSTGRLRHTFVGHTGRVLSVAVGPGGRWLATGSDDRTVRVWDTSTGRLRHTFIGHTDYVLSVAVAPDGTWLATGSDDQTIQIRDTGTWFVRHTLTGHTDRVRSVAVAPDGTWLATGSDDQTIQIWDAATGRLRHVLSGHTDRVLSVAISPDGSWLASGSKDGTIQIWDTAYGVLQRTLSGHTGAVRMVAITPGGTWIASAGEDDTVRIWNTATGTPRATLLPLDNGGYAVLLPDLSYKQEGAANGEFWFSQGFVRFEPGELDPYESAVRRLPGDAPLWPSD